jgi:hypothetical protein
MNQNAVHVNQLRQADIIRWGTCERTVMRSSNVRVGDSGKDQRWLRPSVGPASSRSTARIKPGLIPIEEERYNYASFTRASNKGPLSVCPGEE